MISSRDGILVVVCLIAFACGRELVNSGSGIGQWIGYEPERVELRGHLVFQEEFGPPNFGETPEIDQKLLVPVLELAHPISIRGNENDELNSETLLDVRRVQLNFGESEIYRELVGVEVVVNGTISRAVSGHHFTEVVMQVMDLRLDNSSDKGV